MGKRKNKRLTHAHLGHMSKHHLVPKQRMRDYYGGSFKMPNNILRLWRLKHDAWHVLFKQKTLNEILKYLRKPIDQIYGYKSETWKILFKNNNRKDVYKILLRVRRMIRKRYAFLEFDPSLKKKIIRIEHVNKNRIFGRIYLDKKFSHTA
jgi:hypothetical protein